MSPSQVLPAQVLPSQVLQSQVSPAHKLPSTRICPLAIERMRHADVIVPWSDEFDKMISGMNFKASNSPNMLSHKLHIKQQLQKFNSETIHEDSTLDSLKHARMETARLMMGKLGSNTNIEAPFFCTWGCQTFIGNNCYINRNVSIYDSAPITIGNRVLIAPNCILCTDTHEVESVERQQGSFARPIRIGDDCWLGAGASILPGVTIGRGCTIAAGAVVAKDVEDYCLVGGVPARLIRRLKQAEVTQREHLQKM